MTRTPIRAHARFLRALRALWAPCGAICSPAFAGLRVLHLLAQSFQYFSIRGNPRYYGSNRRVLRWYSARSRRNRGAQGRRFQRVSCFPSRCHGAHLLSNTPSHAIGLTRVRRFSTACQGSLRARLQRVRQPSRDRCRIIPGRDSPAFRPPGRRPQSTGPFCSSR